MKHGEYVYDGCDIVMYLVAVIIYAEKQVRRIWMSSRDTAMTKKTGPVDQL